MNVNLEIYGVETTWTPITLTNDNPLSIRNDAIPKLANFGTSASLINGYENGRLTINTQIDKSISTVGVDDNCILINQAYVSTPVFNENEQEYTEFNVLCNMNKNGTNALCYIQNSKQSENEYPFNEKNYNKFFSGYQQILQTGISTTYYNIQPVTYMPVNNMVWCIFVQCSNSDPYSVRISGKQTFDLYTYCKSDYTLNGVTKKTYEHYPVIINISVVAFYRNKTEFNDNNTTVYRKTMGIDVKQITPCIMNDYNQITNPFSDDDSPFQILNYSQPISTLNEQTVIYNKIITNGNITTYNINQGLGMFCGTRYGNYALTPNNYYNYIGIDKLNCRIWLDNNVIRLNIWTNIEMFGNIDDFYEYWLSQIAYLGGFFTDSIDIALHAKTWNIEHTFIGTIDDNGVTHGYYTQGIDNEKQKQYNWTDFTENNFNPENSRPNGEDKEVASDTYNFNRTYFGFQTGNYYALNENELNNLKLWIDTVTNPAGDFVVNNPDNNEYTYEQLSQEMRKLFNGQYPEDMLLNLMYFPFDIPSNLTGVQIGDSNIKLGAITTQSKQWFDSNLPNVTANELKRGKQYAEFITQPYDIREYFGDFRDYPPYTSMQIVIPYHSTVPIDVGMLYGHSIYVHIFCDIITGTSTAFVMRDNGIPIANVDGQMGVPQMLISRNVGQYVTGLTTNAQNINQLKTQAIQTGIGVISSGAMAIGGLASGNVMTGVSGVVNALNQIPNAMQINKNYENKSIDLKHTQAGSTIISQNSPSVSMISDTNVRLIIHRPKLMPTYNSADYGNTIGFACMDFGSIGNFSGYSIFSGVNLQGISAPENEKHMIYSLLQSGIYI